MFVYCNIAEVPQPAIRPRKKPRQARSADTVETILLAATRVLSECSLVGFNTNRVAEVAGVSIGSLYQYFPNKAALLAALIERAQTSLADAIEFSARKSQGQSMPEALMGLVDIAIEHQFRHSVLAAALDHEEQRLPVEEILAASQSRILNAVQRVLAEHQSLAGVALSTAAVDCLAIAKGIIEAQAAQAQPDLDALRQRLLRALLGYLTDGGSGTPLGLKT